MAIVAKMVATEVKHLGGGHYEGCEEGDEGAISIDAPESPTKNLYTDIPGWLEGYDFVRRIEGVQAEAIVLNAVSKQAGSDPEKTNALWAMASPSGNLTLTIHNPNAWWYVQAGYEYRVTIEKIRGPRDAK